jgi:hypothetical protein
MYYDHEIWPHIDVDDLWLFDKSILSRKLGFKCGPAGVPVPKPGNYIVRPCVNLEGMGKGASIKHIKDSSWDIVPAGYFWQELFTGRHISVDFEYQKQIRATEGFRKSKNLMMFDRWIVVDYEPSIPDFVHEIIKKYPFVNVELVDNKIIEIHLRRNPDFSDGCKEIIPVWEGKKIKHPEGFIFVPDITDERPRLGFYKRYF